MQITFRKKGQGTREGIERGKKEGTRRQASSYFPRLTPGVLHVYLGREEEEVVPLKTLWLLKWVTLLQDKGLCEIINSFMSN